MSLNRFYSKPGFYLRRLHQISVALFYEEAGDQDLTPTQFSVLYVLHNQPNIAQSQVTQLAALDKVTVVNVVARLIEKGLVIKTRSTEDRRASVLALTDTGSAKVEAMEPALDRSAARLVAPLDSNELDTFMSLLAKLAEHNNLLSRAPLNKSALKANPSETKTAPFGSDSLEPRFLDDPDKTEP